MALVSLSTPGRLEADAAAAYERAIWDVWLEHDVDVSTTDPWHAARTVADQEEIFFDRYEPRPWPELGPYGDVRTYKGVRYVRISALGPAAIPGTSNHGSGRTVDFQNVGWFGTSSYNRIWKALNEHGFNNKEGAQPDVREPWHGNYVAADDQHKEDEVPSMDAIADAVWRRKYKTPSALVADLGTEVPLERLVAYAANKANSANQNAVRNRAYTAGLIADALASIPGATPGGVSRDDVERVIREVLGSLDDDPGDGAS